MNEENKIGYYAIIPANVRYDNELTEKDKEILKNETEEFQNKQFEIDFMTSMHKNMEEKEEQEDEEEM